MKVWALSDTHGLHNQITIPKGIDCILYGGDCTNWKDIQRNEREFKDFLSWFSKLEAKYKVVIAGNHDAWAMKLYLKEELEKIGVIYLEHKVISIEGKSIFGSPYTPNFGDWYFMKDRGKLGDWWTEIPDNLDILLTHGPPMSILDLTENRDYQIEQCGDTALYNQVMRKKPKVHIFGHIHNFKTCRNQGIREYEGIKFMNVSCVEDGRFDKGPTSHGITFEI